MSDIRASFLGRGERGKRGPTGPTGSAGAGATGSTGPAGPSTPQFEPDRTLFVSPVWPAGVDPTVYFTDITSAIAAAAAFTPPPSQANPAAILIYPGSYSDTINVASWVALIGATGAFPDVELTGSITWTPIAATQETAFLYFLGGAPPVTVDTTGKTGGQTTFIAFNSFLDAVTYTGRGIAGPTRDLVEFWDCVPGMTPYTFSNALIEYKGGRLNAITFNNGCDFNIAGSTNIEAATAAWNVNTGSTGEVVGCLITTPWNIDGTSAVAFTGTNINQPITVSGPGGYADVRATNYNGAANLVLAGPAGATIDRTTSTISFGPTVVGANPVALAIPFSDNAYNIALQLTSGPGSAAITVTGKLNTGFTINDPVGGNTFDIIANHE